MEDILYQEIDIKLNIIFLQPQLRLLVGRLDSELKTQLEGRNGYLNQKEPLKVTEIESSINNAHVRLTTSVDARKCDEEITRHITYKVRQYLSMGVVDIEVMSFREEAEIYGNV